MYQFLTGNRLQFSWQVNDQAGWVSPSNVSLILKPPTGSSETLNPALTSVGNYLAEWATDNKTPGVWTYRWQGDGVAEEGTFEVKASQVI